MQPLISIKNLTKTYESGFQALNSVDLDIAKGEIFALLGPNGAGKTTLISIVCGLVNATGGSVTVDGHDNVRDYRRTRALIGLVPQELTTDAFETVEASVKFTRTLFGKAANPSLLEHILKSLTLWDKRHQQIMALSGGMKRRLMIAKALSHEPQILFLDEPTAGVDVELRKDMWELIGQLREQGVTIILTTHYIEEAEQIADRIGVINKGELILVERTQTLMQSLGKKQLRIRLREPLAVLPSSLAEQQLEIVEQGSHLLYTYLTQEDETGMQAVLDELRANGIEYLELSTRQSTLEEIFVNLVQEQSA